MESRLGKPNMNQIERSTDTLSSLSMHAKHQKMIREVYPDENVPEELKTFKETGMYQGALGGPVGGGVGMTMSSGI